MLERFFKKKLGVEPAIQEEVEMTVETQAPALAAQSEEAVAALAALQASFDEQAVALAAALSQVETLQAQLTQFADAAAQAEAAAKELAAKAHQEKMEARMTALTTEFGEDTAAKLSSVIEKMEDAEFSAVFGVQKALAAKEEESFAEQGVDAKAESVEKQPTHFKQFIKKETK